MNALLAIAIFILILLLLEGGYLLYRNIRNTEKKEVRKRLNALSMISQYEGENIDLVRKKMLSELPWFNRLLLRFHLMDKTHHFLEQSAVQKPLGFFVLLSLLLAIVGFLIGSSILFDYLLSIPLAVCLGIMPFFYIYSKKRRRMRKFERQFPDAMDLIARALRAGHAFSSGLKMVAEEFDDPIGTEFGRTLNEINFGVGVAEALQKLANRVDCPDIGFFVISVILQRETGGNLAEILENIARLIRERFKLHGHVRTLSAEGRLSAIVLVVLPFLVAFYIYLVNPEYIKLLIEDPMGKIMALFALIMMIAGIFAIKRLIAIKV